MRVVLDLEGDNLLQKVSKLWIIGWKDKDTGKIYKWHDGDEGWRTEIEKVTTIIGHNVIGYDLPALLKLKGWEPKKSVKIQDTLILSQVLNYNRFTSRRHSLEEWGQFLGFPKLESPDFTQWTPYMDEYWEGDLHLTDKVHDVVYKEYTNYKTQELTTYLRVENAVAKWCALAELYGWPFAVEDARALFEKMELELTAVKDKLTPRLGTKTVAVDKKNGVVETKTAKFLKNGFLDRHTANWFGVPQESGLDDLPPVKGEYCRLEFRDLDLDSVADVKIFLFRNGWVPTEYNTKPDPDGRGKIQTSPKITEDSLECMQGDGKLYCDFLTTKSRHSILKGWLNAVDADGNLHGECFTIGTPSMRARHSTIVNVPSADAPWGKEMRNLFISKPGWKLIGCDSSGNQARGLAHYLKSPEFVDLLLHGDIHQRNADLLTEILHNHKINHVVPRSAAKRILYAFLFGASGGKLWSYIFGTIDDAKGKWLKKDFINAVPGFKDLLTKLENIYGKTKTFGDGYIPGIAGNRIYCDSFHKLLVYLLQAAEKATCGAALMLTMDRLEAEKIPYQPVMFMHDEIDFLVPEEYAERAKEIGTQSFSDGPKLFGVEIMGGEGKIGNSWYEVH